MTDDRGDTDITAVLAGLDAATADVFDLDLRIGPSAPDVPRTCSGDCTNDGCTSPTRC